MNICDLICNENKDCEVHLSELIGELSLSSERKVVKSSEPYSLWAKDLILNDKSTGSDVIKCLKLKGFSVKSAVDDEENCSLIIWY